MARPRRGEQHEVLAGAEQQAAEDVGAVWGIGIAIVMRLVDHDQGVFLEIGFEVLEGGIGAPMIVELPVACQLVVGHHFDESADIVGMKEILPGSAQRGRVDEKGALAVFGAGFEDRAADKSFSEADLVGDDDAAEFAEDAAGTPDAVQLKRGERDVAGFLAFQRQFVAIELPENAHENQPRRKFGVRFLENRGEVENHRVVPQRIEPGLGLGEDFWVPVAEVEFEILGQAGLGEVGRSGDQAGIATIEQDGLGMQKGAFVAAGFKHAGAQHRRHAAQVAAGVWAEGLAIAVVAEAGLKQFQPLGDFAAFKGRLRRVAGLATGAAGLRFRFRTDQQPDMARLLEPFGQGAEAGGADEGGGDADLGEGGWCFGKSAGGGGGVGRVGGVGGVGDGGL